MSASRSDIGTKLESLKTKFNALASKDIQTDEKTGADSHQPYISQVYSEGDEQTLFRTDYIVKIWFSRPEAEPFGHKSNICRLAQHRNNFPNDIIYVITNVETFDAEKRRLFEAVCTQFNLRSLSMHDIKAKIENSNDKDKKIQQALFSFALAEIEHGNLGAASDIVRVLSAVAALGIYSDFDEVKSKTTAETLLAKLGLKLTLSLRAVGGVYGLDAVHNATFACDESQSAFLTFVRNYIYKYYTRIESLTALKHRPCFSQSQIEKLSQILLLPELQSASASNTQEGSVKSPLPILIRSKYQSLYPNEYEAFLKNFIIEVSGPSAFFQSFKYGLSTQVNSIRESLFQDRLSPVEEAKLKEELLSSQMITGSIIDGRFRPSGYMFDNQNDISWLASAEAIERNFKKHYDNEQFMPILSWYQKAISCTSLSISLSTNCAPNLNNEEQTTQASKNSILYRFAAQNNQPDLVSYLIAQGATPTQPASPTKYAS